MTIIAGLKQTQLLAEVLKSNGYNVVETVDSSDCVVLSARLRPDIIIIGKKIGFKATCQKIRKQQTKDAFLILAGDSKTEREGSEISQLLENCANQYLNIDSPFFISQIKAIARSIYLKKTEEEKFKVLSESTSSAIFIYKGEKFVYANPKTEELTGRSKEELLNMRFWDVVHPDFKELIRQRGLERQRGKRVPGRYEFKIVSKTGAERWINFTAGKITYNGEPAAIGTAFDITDIKVAEEKIIKSSRMYTFISQVNQLIVHEHDKNKLMQKLCDIAIEYGKFCMAWFGLVDKDKNSVIPAFYSGTENGYFSAIKQIDLNDASAGNGPTGQAIKSGKHYACNDIENDPNMKLWADEALKRGYRSSIALPVNVFGKIIGVYNLYSDIVGFFDEQEIDLLIEVSLDISYAFENMEIEEKRKDAERKLQESEEKFRKAFKATPDSVNINRLNGKYVDINDGFTRITGYTTEDVIGKTSVEIGIWADPADRKRLIELLNKDGSVHNLEAKFRCKDGTIKTGLMSAIIINLNNEPHILSITRDITERKKVEEEMRNLAIRWQSTFDAMTDSVSIIDLEGKINICNRSTYSMFGIDKDDIKTKKCYQMIHGAEKPFHNCPLERMKISRKHESMIFKRLDKWLRVDVDPIFNEKAELTGAVHVVSDITEQKEVEQHLIASEESLKEAQRIAHIGHWSHYLENRRVFWSDEIYNIFGVSKNEFKQTHDGFIKFVYPDDIEKVQRAFNDVLIDGKERTIKCRIVKGDSKEIRYVEINYKRFKDENGQIAGVKGTTQDITERERLIQEIKKKDELLLIQSRQAAMGEMISMIAHQWRQPLSVISMGANNILADIELDSVSIDELKRISNLFIEQTGHLSKTIDDFRNFFKPHKNIDNVFIEDVLESALKFTGKSLESNLIEVRKSCSSTSPVKTYSRELLQAIIAIIQNAKEALVEKEIKNRLIDIKAYEKDDRIYIKICDNAGGIEKDIINRIFEPYFSTKDKKTGTGLGLYMAKTIVERHLKGRIWAENKGDGACFTIELQCEKNR